MTTIMRVFPAYTVQGMLETPIAHVMKLYDMAERAIQLERYDIMIGNLARHDQGLANSLQKVAQAYTITDQNRLKELMSAENVKRVLNRIDNLKGAMGNG